jgi:DNA-binding NarL/FixJ family response regulator
MEQVQVILSGSSPVVLSGLRSFVEKHHRIRVIREVATSGLLEETLTTNRGCLVIVDWQSTSLENVARIAKNCKLIVYAMPESIEAWRNALQIGVRGFIGKDQSAADIRRAVLSVADGQIWIGKTSAEAILGYELSSGRGQSVARIDGPGQLTNREKQVIEAACRGLKSRGIALALRISGPTVAHHLTSVYAKLGVADRVGLIIYAYQHSLHLPEMKTLPGEQSKSFQISGVA